MNLQKINKILSVNDSGAVGQAAKCWLSFLRVTVYYRGGVCDLQGYVCRIPIALVSIIRAFDNLTYDFSFID